MQPMLRGAIPGIRILCEQTFLRHQTLGCARDRREAKFPASTNEWLVVGRSHRSPINRSMAVDHSVEREAFVGANPVGPAQPAARRSFFRQLIEAPSQCGFIVLGDYKGIVLLRQHKSNVADVGRRHGQSTGHAFDQTDRHLFGV